MLLHQVHPIQTRQEECKLAKSREVKLAQQRELMQKLRQARRDPENYANFASLYSREMYVHLILCGPKPVGSSWDQLRDFMEVFSGRQQQRGRFNLEQFDPHQIEGVA